MCMMHPGIQTTSQNSEPWKEDSSRRWPLSMSGNESWPIFLLTKKCCRHVFKVFPTLTSWPFTEFGSTVTKNLSSAAFVDKDLWDSKYWTSMWRCTLVKDRSGELSNVWLLYLIKLWQVWPVWWGFHPGWRSKETRPETQDQRGHPYRGGKATAWNGKKALWVLWS